MFIRTKKAQVTIFVILGIVIITAFAFVFVIVKNQNSNSIDTTATTAKQSLDEQSFRLFIQNCFSSAAKSAINQTLWMGGPSLTKTQTVTNLFYSFAPQSIISLSDGNAYYYYNQGMDLMPETQDFETSFATIAQEKFRECLDLNIPMFNNSNTFLIENNASPITITASMKGEEYILFELYFDADIIIGTQRSLVGKLIHKEPVQTKLIYQEVEKYIDEISNMNGLLPISTSLSIPQLKVNNIEQEVRLIQNNNYLFTINDTTSNFMGKPYQWRFVIQQ